VIIRRKKLIEKATGSSCKIDDKEKEKPSLFVRVSSTETKAQKEKLKKSEPKNDIASQAGVCFANKTFFDQTSTAAEKYDAETNMKNEASIIISSNTVACKKTAWYELH
jgi:phage major head subunit gpT-like protein